MTATRSKKYSTLLFLFLIFVLLVVFGFSYVHKMYGAALGSSKETTETIVTCGEYSFQIENMGYDEGDLRFRIRNLYGANMDFIIVEVNEVKQEVKTNGLVGGEGNELVAENIDITFGDTIFFYPPGCKEHNSKQFKMK